LQSQNIIDLYTFEEDETFNGRIAKENANKFDSYSKLRGLIADEEIKNYLFERVYPEDVVQAHRDAFIHIHDLSDGVVPYCKGHDTKLILVKGLITKTVVASSPKHLSSFLDQLINFIATSQQEWAGAQALPDLNTLAAPFVRKDNLTYKRIKQAVQSFIYNVNFPSRAGFQTPFLNVTLNIKCPEHLRDEEVYNAGCEGTYGDYEKEARLILKAFNDILYEGDAAGRPFTFPLVTISLLPNTDFSDPIWIDIMKTEIKYGSYSFFNYIGSGIDPFSRYAMCCHLQLDINDIRELFQKLAPTGGRWDYAGGTGSIGVVTLNMGKLGYLAKNEEDLFRKLDELLSLAKKALIIKSIWIERNKHRYMPLTMEYGFDHRFYFRTIGVIGLNEMCVNFFSRSGHFEYKASLFNHVDFVKRVLNHIREWTRKTQMETETLWNLEMTPAEGSATRFAFRDIELYGNDIYLQGIPGAWYYTSMLTPPSDPLTLGERIEAEQDLLSLFTGGTVFRIYIGEANPSPEALVKLMMRIAVNTRIAYFDFDPTYSVCLKCKLRNPGAVESCLSCGGETLIYDRIVGYYRPRSNVNVGKLQEIRERLQYL